MHEERAAEAQLSFKFLLLGFVVTDRQTDRQGLFLRGYASKISDMSVSK